MLLQMLSLKTTWRNVDSIEKEGAWEEGKAELLGRS